MATNYIGNNDYRGYLNYLAQNGDSAAVSLLNVAGNDGGVSKPDMYINNGQTAYVKASDLNDQYYSDWQHQKRVGAIQQGWDTVKAIQDGAKQQKQQQDTQNQNQTLNSQSSYVDTSAAEKAKAEAEAAAAKRRLLDYYNDTIAGKENEISALDAGLQNQLDTLKGQYDVYKNEQQSAYNSEKNNYDEASKQNRQNLQNSRNEIDQKAALGLRSLKSILGGMGAGGGSVALYNVPQMVKNVADSGYAGANNNFATNQSNLDTTWGGYNNDYENDKKKLEDWLIGQEKSAKQNVENQRISLLGELADLFGNRAANTDEGVGDNIKSINQRKSAAQNKIHDLGKYETPNYNGITAVYKTPSLSEYDTGNVDLSSDIQNSGNDNSLLTMLRGLKKKNNMIGA